MAKNKNVTTKLMDVLDEHGAILCKDVLSKEMCEFLTSVLLRKSEIDPDDGDEQVSNSRALISHDIFLETIQEKLWVKLEQLLGEELLPTYTYSRLYSNECSLEKHRDRPACEISITVQLGRSHHYAWEIYVGKHRYDLAEGDGVIYKGHEVEHWRNTCKGPDNYYSGQVFFHFVKKNGKHSKEFGDSKNTRKVPNNFFVRNRAHIMENK